MNRQHLDNKKQYILEILVEELSKDANIMLAYIFGSLTSKNIAQRDLDVGVFLREITSPLIEEKYEIILAISLEEIVACPVDVVILNQAPLSIQYHITRGELVFCRNKNSHFNFRERIWRDYFDFQPLARQMLFEVFSR